MFMRNVRQELFCQNTGFLLRAEWNMQQLAQLMLGQKV
jgi:hypothetical protein